MTPWAILLTAFIAALVQSMTGFGSGIIPMAILPTWLHIRTAVPMVALLTATVDLGMLVRHRAAVRVRAVLPLAGGMILGIPLGILFVRRMEERWVLGGLGAVVVLYALYSLARSVGLGVGDSARHQRKSPLSGPSATDQISLPLSSAPDVLTPGGTKGARLRGWVALLPTTTGLIAGMLGGAYNTSGPPLVIYGDARRWEPAEFRGNLQTLFLINDALVIAGHLAAGNITPAVLHGYLLALPGLGLGFLVGGLLAQRLSPKRFRLFVQGLLLVLGARLFL
ncbi:MAG: sulfite exporter TauE/SafE family protein [Anaerolineae bacterium]|nr:sulfite exporter TauE/SafE family protein [Anaerolineae bacterium]MDW7991755.1 sulfite exporter TauE/SafE family protein [Anaerolineae bacterium]